MVNITPLNVMTGVLPVVQITLAS